MFLALKERYKNYLLQQKYLQDMPSEIKIDKIPNEWHKLASSYYFFEMRVIHSVV